MILVYKKCIFSDMYNLSPCDKNIFFIFIFNNKLFNIIKFFKFLVFCCIKKSLLPFKIKILIPFLFYFNNNKII